MSLIGSRDSPDGMHNMKSDRAGGKVGKGTIQELLNHDYPLTNVDTVAPAVSPLGRR